MSYLLLFVSAFLAATLLPFYSEITLVALLDEERSVFLLWLFATAGNTLGAVVNWVIGRYLLHYQEKKWFPFKGKSLKKAQNWFNRYGVWSLLFAWLPIGGDALTFIAGVLKVKFWLMFILTAIGKGVRYWIVILIAQGVLG